MSILKPDTQEHTALKEGLVNVKQALTVLSAVDNPSINRITAALQSVVIIAEMFLG